ncbi:MAG: cold shock domain-containing protein [Phycisphaerales bacterium]|nr:cold shock domain-containing protein [Phycisphaerales bacterium]
MQGSVKWFDPRKGFGFIVGPDNQDIFVHYTIIEGEGFRVLTDGSPVTYNAENGDKGWRATKVVALDIPSSDSSDSSDAADSETDSEAEVVVPKRTYTRTPRR